LTTDTKKQTNNIHERIHLIIAFPLIRLFHSFIQTDKREGRKTEMNIRLDFK